MDKLRSEVCRLQSIKITKHNVMQNWRRRVDLFPDIRGSEEDYNPLIYVIEQQIGFMVNRNSRFVDEQILTALALCGLRCAEQIVPDTKLEFQGFDEMMVALTERCLASFHPDYNPEIKAVTDRLWSSSDIRIEHFTAYGAAIRRLMYSVQFWGKASGTLRGYVNHVVDFLSEAGHDVTTDYVHFHVYVSPDAVERDLRASENWKTSV